VWLSYGQSIEPNWLRVRVIGIVLASLYCHTEYTVELLQNHATNNLSWFVSEVTALTHDFTHIHDKKLAIMGLMNFIHSYITRAHLHPLIRELLISVVRIIKAKRGLGTMASMEQSEGVE
jgi:hypothetical protein